MNALTLIALEGTAWGDNKLAVLWFVLIGVLWIGFFFLEGFDYGVAMLLPFLGRDDKEKRVMVNTIGPHWDGNEVWLLTAGGATFAAFAGWYASLFSSLYLPLFLVLVGLILRGVAFEYRGKQDSPTWRKTWDWLAAIGSFLPSLVLGVGFANFLKGVVITAATVPEPIGMFQAGGVGLVPIYDGFWGLFHPFCLVGGLLFVVLFATHGALFLSLKTTGSVKQQAQATVSKLGLVALALLAVFVVWGNLVYGAGRGTNLGSLSMILAWVTGLLAIVTLAGAWYFNRAGRDGLAFLCGGLAVVTMIVTVLIHMFPNLGFDSTVIGQALGLEASPDLLPLLQNSETTLTLMTWVAAIMVPVVLLYQIWTWFVFKRRISTANIVDDTRHAARAA
ncbi:MAG: cytochrome d ubiquinol oxidase subunit II [Propionibacteriaceae bacterium]|jgi:cytochrome d ubiquinol oxidase subunit II|nr:cytochrome d ubiquinol oxidase subunit II [Propionibacteriaceae bacterium]